MSRIRCNRADYENLQEQILQKSETLGEACMRLETKKYLGPLKFQNIRETEKYVENLFKELRALITYRDSLTKI